MKRFWKQRTDVAEEIQAHLGERTDELIATGLSPEDAARRARREFGNVALLTEQSREVWGWRWFDRRGQDLRYAVRMMRRSPAFTAIAVLSLALGIGANTAIFSVIESTLLSPIPAEKPEQLRLLLWESQDGRWVPPNISSFSSTYRWFYERLTSQGSLIHSAFAPSFYQEVMRSADIFEIAFGVKEIGTLTATVHGSPEPVTCFLISGTFYKGMGVTPAIGRPIAPQDDFKSAPAVAVISNAYWKHRFAGNPSVIGQTVILNSVPVTIVGVNPETFTGVQPGANFDFWAPLSLPLNAAGNSILDDSGWSIPIMGRLRPGVSDGQAQQALELILHRQIERDYPNVAAADRPHLMVESGARGLDYLNEHYAGPMFALFCLSGLLLLIACANVANLLLAKSAARQREISLRLALGAGPRRIAAQLLTEGGLLAAMAGVLGALFGYGSRTAIPRVLRTAWRTTPFQASFDPKVLLICMAITLAAGLFFTLAPVWHARRVDVNEALKQVGSRSDYSKLPFSRMLVATQVTISVVLLAVAGLCVTTFRNMTNASLGFRPGGILLFSLVGPPGTNHSAEPIRVIDEVRDRLTEIPGVQSDTYSSQPLISGRTQFLLGAKVAPTGRPENALFVGYNNVGDQFFETMAMPILYGRAVHRNRVFTQLSPVREAVVNQQFGRHFFGRENSVGQTFMAVVWNVTFEIVGVCPDGPLNQLRDSVQPAFYADSADISSVGGVTFEVKVGGDTGRVVPQIRDRIRSVEDDLAVIDVRTQQQQIDDTLAPDRLVVSLAMFFGVLSLVLVCIGIHGVVAYEVTRRMNEIGIRVALGAQPGRVIWLVMGETFTLVLLGIAAAIPLLVVLHRVLDRSLAAPFTHNFLYGTTADDPRTIAAAILIVAAAGLFAACRSARRGAHVDPIVALRRE